MLWRQFLDELDLYERGMASTLLKGVRNLQVANFKNSSTATQFRKFLNKENVWPRVEGVWDFAECVRSLRKPELPWCAGPLALFHASHFKAFAAIMLNAKDKGMPSRMLAKLCTYVEDVEHRDYWKLTEEESQLFQDAYDDTNHDGVDICVTHRDYRIVAVDLATKSKTHDILKLREIIKTNLAEYFREA